MKKILSLFLALLISLCFASCEDINNESALNLQSQIETLKEDKIELQALVETLNNTIDYQANRQKELEEDIQDLKNSNADLQNQLEKKVTPPPSKPSTYSPPSQQPQQSVTVYVTKTGSKYHKSGCQYLRQSCIAKSLSNATSQGYTPCSKCY